MKIRLDKLLVERGLAPTRERAQALILAGRVLVAEQKLSKPGHAVSADAPIRLLGSDLRYVSRGGLKLEAALAHWRIDLHGRFCLDIGASTGGFTDCMLQAGAVRVLAVDTGYGQIAQSLRDDPRVTLMERTNARLLNPGDLPPGIGFFSVDVSFISATLVLPPVLTAIRRASDTAGPARLKAPGTDSAGGTTPCKPPNSGKSAYTENSGAFVSGHDFSRADKTARETGVLAPEESRSGADPIQHQTEKSLTEAPDSFAGPPGPCVLQGHDFIRAVQASKETGALAPERRLPLEAVILIKPQFEAGREHVGKGGIVRDPAAHQLAIDRVRACIEELGGVAIEVIDSPITGAEGNREFLLHATWP